MEQAEEFEQEYEKLEKEKKPHNLKSGKVDEARVVVGKGLKGIGAAISALPVLLLAPICLVVGVITALIGIAVTIAAVLSMKDPVSGLIIVLPLFIADRVGLICLSPALLPYGIGYGLNKLIAPKAIEQF